jgi:glycosyltransferase involved in cell wall biosynthesis
MPFVLKDPTPSSKGILILTHKEARVLDAPAPPVAAALAGVRERYHVGLHWGHFASGVERLPWVEFHLAGRGTLRLAPGNDTPHIPLASRNFLPDLFADQGLDRHWDVLSVARPLRLKNLDELLRALRHAWDTGRPLSALLLCPAPARMDDDGWYGSIYDDYLRMFSEDERDHVVVLLLRDGYPFPLGPQTMTWLYNSSKAFALFSDQEGESRVVAEALVCGCHVAVKHELRGGADDYLDASNSARFTTVEEAADALAELAARPPVALTPALQDELYERATAPRLRRELTELLRLPEDADGWHLDDLARRLPGHVLALPPGLRAELTNDLASQEEALVYFGMLTGHEPTPAERRKVRSATTAARVRERALEFAGRARYRAGALVRRG